MVPVFVLAFVVPYEDYAVMSVHSTLAGAKAVGAAQYLLDAWEQVKGNDAAVAASITDMRLSDAYLSIERFEVQL